MTALCRDAHANPIKAEYSSSCSHFNNHQAPVVRRYGDKIESVETINFTFWVQCARGIGGHVYFPLRMLYVRMLYVLFR